MADPDHIARLCYARLESLPRRGRPEAGREWSLLAAVLQTDAVKTEVVSLGTGTKCIGQSHMSPNGDVLNDSHAEVIARRGCIRYLLQQLHSAVSGGSSSVFCPSEEPGKWRLRPGVSFLFFTSHTPCGDASIIPMTDSPSQPRPPGASEKSREGTGAGGDLKRKSEDPSEGPHTKLARVDNQETRTEDGGDTKTSFPSKSCQSEGFSQTQATETPEETREEEASATRGPCASTGLGGRVPDVHRTGAKCVPGGAADPLQPGSGYHSTGELRVKPGRGEPTLSLSCTDKLSRWAVLGFQGALLSHYLQGALYFSTLVVGKCPYSKEVMNRALVTRCSHVTDLPAGFSVTPPELLQSGLEFRFSQAQTERQHQATQGRISPCGAAISWCNVSEQPLDVTANGYKHGVTKKVSSV
ncbi:tRNA-specific adenosine deaminase 1 isoform X2 [Limanda limanda]|uniref:tRNA-specific adenosine deaminase 1 isoform X2 n=1 Tax=Limanda limanda TaxID=27771 RepID=UPI0029C623C1|nr:tRNA-specific adenosine deaminase 1 isoform X2 [Limanda limanda]